MDQRSPLHTATAHSHIATSLDKLSTCNCKSSSPQPQQPPACHCPTAMSIHFPSGKPNLVQPALPHFVQPPLTVVVRLALPSLVSPTYIYSTSGQTIANVCTPIPILKPASPPCSHSHGLLMSLLHNSHLFLLDRLDLQLQSSHLTDLELLLSLQEVCRPSRPPAE